MISTDIQSSNDQEESSGAPVKKEVEISDSEDDEISKMMGGDSKFLKNLKKEAAAAIKQVKEESEGEEEDQENDYENKPYKAPKVTSIDEL